MKLIRWFQVISIILLAIVLVPLSPIYPYQNCYSKDNETLIALTFDDGYSCWISEVMPILTHYDLPATAFINNPNYRNDFSWSDVRQLHNARWEIGWHTAKHISLDLVSQDIISNECRNSKKLFEWYGLPPPTALGYPTGDHDLTSMEIITEYFLAARTTHLGVNSPCYIKDNPCHLKHIWLDGSPSYFEKFVNKYAQQGVLIVFTTHTVGQTAKWQYQSDMTVEDFEYFIKFLYQEKQKNNIDVVTFSEGVRRMQVRETNPSWGIKLDSPFDSWIDVYGISIPERYFIIYERIIQDFIGHSFPRFVDRLDGIIFGPVGLSLILATALFITATIIITCIGLLKSKKRNL